MESEKGASIVDHCQHQCCFPSHHVVANFNLFWKYQQKNKNKYNKLTSLKKINSNHLWYFPCCYFIHKE